MSCNQCGGSMGVSASHFPGWLLLACTLCGRPVKLLPESGPRLGSGKKIDKAAVNRAMRAARRAKARQA